MSLRHWGSLTLATAAIGMLAIPPGGSALAAGEEPSAQKAVARLSDAPPDLNGTWDNGSGIDFVQPQKEADGSVCIAGCKPVAAAAPPPPPPPSGRPPAT